MRFYNTNILLRKEVEERSPLPPAKLDLSPNSLTPMLEKTSTFQKAIEAVEALDPEAQAILVDIIQKRLKQQRRDDLLKAVAEAREAYARGEVRSGTVADLMAELDD
ncbi:hypothetical protein [Nostoc sp.]|uniref:hypothetical protein n=1 Tax=Nostoc sp. TaxID=1180 RepID=UPI002FF8E8CE